MPSARAARPRHLLDTNILIHYVRGKDLGQWLEATYALQQTPVAPLISAVTEGEVRAMARGLAWGPAKVQRMHQLLGHFIPVMLDLPGLYDAYAEVREISHVGGITMGDNDAWIAATAKVTGALLLTTDKDFDQLHPGYLSRDYIDPQQHRPRTP